MHMHSAVLCCRAVTICLSYMHVYCVETTELIIK